MIARAFLALCLLWSGSALAAEVNDATGRTVQIPDHVARVLPAGPPAAVLLEAVAPDLMIGWPSKPSDEARALLAPAAARLPEIPRLTGKDDVADKIKAIKPDLILDYGSVAPRYVDLAKATQQSTGVPAILLDGSLAQIPQALRTLGRVLHREDRAETLANMAEALLSLPVQPGAPKILYARGEDGLSVAAPESDAAEVFRRLGWTVVAPPGQGDFRTTTIDAIRKLDPDVVFFADPHMLATLQSNAPAWQAVRAVHAKQAFVVPSLPFGWVDEPPSINRLLGLAWLGGSEPGTLTAVFNAVVYGHVLTPTQHDTILAPFRPLQH